MEIGTILLYIAFTLGLGSAILSILYLRSKDEIERKYARYLLFGCFIILTFAFFLLHIMYVHGYTHSSYALYYKLAGAWAGQKGSIMLWTWLIAVALTIEESIQWRRQLKSNTEPARSGIGTWVRLIAMIVLIAFIGLLIQIEMFKVTDPFSLSLFPEGRGLNPLLLTPLMIAHPPLEFIAYALVTIPFAAALTYLVTGNRKWVDISLQWGRLAWLFYTLAIGIGALWAYTVLGWGGYWAWDPVETVNLIPWISTSFHG
jgi:cytochrome c-type biogenesis protein CcmF